MTYRDDHEAALARARALEAELARVRAERDRLARGPAAAAPDPATIRPQEAPAQPRVRKARSRGGRVLAMIYLVVTCGLAAAAYAIVRPDRMGHPAYTVLVVGVAALVGVYFVSQRKQFTTQGIGPDMVFLVVWGLPMLLALGGLMQCVGTNRETCRQDIASAPDRRTEIVGRVAALERRDDVAANAPCTLQLQGHRVSECGTPCTVTLVCDGTVLLHAPELETCEIVGREIQIARDATPDTVGVRATVDVETGAGSGFVYHEPGYGRLPWRVDVSFGPSP